MFDDIKYLIEKSEVPHPVRLALSIVTKAASWLPWVFIGVGLFLTKENFPYWLGFFIFAEGALIAALIYMLLLIVRNSLMAQQSQQLPDDGPAANTFSDAALKGIVGNFAFYLFILTGFVVLKAIGIFDAMFKAALERFN